MENLIHEKPILGLNLLTMPAIKLLLNLGFSIEIYLIFRNIIIVIFHIVPVNQEI